MYMAYTPALQVLFLVSAVVVVVVVKGNRLRTPIPRPQSSVDSEVDLTVTELEEFESLRWDNTQMGRTRGQLEVYKAEIENKMRGAETPEDYLQIFFPNGNMDTIWNDIVNSSMNLLMMTGIGTQTGRVRPIGTEKGMREEYSDERSIDIREELTQHMREMSCIQPKPTLVDMYEELNITRNRPVYIVPECTLLMRCHNGDCCSRIKPCLPREGTRETVTKSFMITEIKLYSKNDVLEPSPHTRLLNYTFQEDTICDCLGPPRQPRCDLTCTDSKKRLNEKYCQCECIKRCPRPYTQDEETCTCDCLEPDSECKKVKRGKRKIQRPECNCISSGKCYSPPCKKGYVFSERLCKCDIKRRRPPSSRQTRNRNPPRRGRFGGGEVTESVAGGHSGCVTEAPTQSVDKNSDVNWSTTKQSIPLTAEPSGRVGPRNYDMSVRTDSSCEDTLSDNGQESDEDKTESSGFIPPL